MSGQTKEKTGWGFLQTGGLKLTEGEPFRLIMRFAIPLFIGSVFQQIYNVVDSVVVGRFVGAGALAAVGCCGPAYNLILALVMGLSTAASVLIAQSYGSGNREQVRRSYATAAGVILLCGAVLTVVGLIASRPLLLILGTPADILDMAASYLQTICGGILATCLYNIMSNSLQARGNSTVPLLVLILASLLNVVLDLVFVICFGMGVPGVALATVLSQMFSALLALVYCSCRIEDYRLKGLRKELSREAAAEVFRIGLPAALSSSIVMISAMFMQRVVNSWGSSVTAAYTVGNRTEQIFMCLSYSIGMAVGTFAGQNEGAEQYGRVKKGMHCGYLINLIYTAVMGTAMYVFAPQVLGIFTNDAHVIAIGVPLVHITAIFSPVLGFVFIFQNFLRNSSDIAPTIWMSASEILARSILSFVFSALFGFTGIWWATPVGWTGSMLIGCLRYRSGRWKQKSIASRQRLAGAGDTCPAAPSDTIV